MTSNGTSEPGVRLSEGREQPLLSRFFAAYRRVRADQAPNVPTWSTFVSAVRVDQDFLLHPTLDEYEKLNVIFEHRDAIYAANVEEIRRYFRQLEPWEDDDIYIVPEDMSWCIAFTHEQLDGIHVYVAGDTERFT